MYKGGPSSDRSERKMAGDRGAHAPRLSFPWGFPNPTFPAILTVLLFSEKRVDKLLQGYRAVLPKFTPVLPSTHRAKDTERY